MAELRESLTRLRLVDKPKHPGCSGKFFRQLAVVPPQRVARVGYLGWMQKGRSIPTSSSRFALRTASERSCDAFGYQSFSSREASRGSLGSRAQQRIREVCTQYAAEIVTAVSS